MKIGKMTSVAIAAFVLTTGGAFAEGKAVGQNDLLLQSTKCGNNGGGNDAEILTRGKVKGEYECVKNVVLKFGEDNRCDVDPTVLPKTACKDPTKPGH